MKEGGGNKKGGAEASGCVWGLSPCWRDTPATLVLRKLSENSGRKMYSVIFK